MALGWKTLSLQPAFVLKRDGAFVKLKRWSWHSLSLAQGLAVTNSVTGSSDGEPPKETPIAPFCFRLRIEGKQVWLEVRLLPPKTLVGCAFKIGPLLIQNKKINVCIHKRKFDSYFFKYMTFKKSGATNSHVMCLWILTGRFSVPPRTCILFAKCSNLTSVTLTAKLNRLHMRRHLIRAQHVIKLIRNFNS